MTEREITDKDRRRARFCAWCPVCRRARRNPPILINLIL